MRSASPKPRVMARRSGSPLRSKRALVATVVPILTPSMGPAPCSAISRRMPSTAASSYCSGLSESSFALSTRPSGAVATMSVKVPPRSIEKDQLPIIRGGSPAAASGGGDVHLADHAIEHRQQQDEVGAACHHRDAGRTRLGGVLRG